MQELNKEDLELIEKAREVIKKNYDGKRYNHTVGSALRCKSGRIYLGVNVYSVHGTCAEQVALGSAITDGERDFDTIVAVDGEDRKDPLSLRKLPAGLLRLHARRLRHRRRQRQALQSPGKGIDSVFLSCPVLRKH